MATAKTGKTTRTCLSVMAYAKDADIDNVQRAKELARLALAADPAALKLDVVEVSLAYGYDIGIATSWRWSRQSHQPAEWLAP